MERRERVKKQSKSAAALEALRAAKAGERPQVDDSDTEGEKSACDDGISISDKSLDESLASKRKRDGDARERLSKKTMGSKAGSLMQAMWLKAPVIERPNSVDDDALLEKLLGEMDEPADQRGTTLPARTTARSLKRPHTALNSVPNQVLDLQEPAVMGDHSDSFAPEPNGAGPEDDYGSNAALDLKRPDPDESCLNAPIEVGPLPTSPCKVHPSAEAAKKDSMNADVGRVAPRRFAPGLDVPFGPPSGWQAALDATVGDDACTNTQIDTMDKCMGEATQDVPSAGCTSEVPFFLLDAHYEPSQPGMVYLVGKVAQDGQYQSACAAVKNVKQCLFVIPRPFVFEDADGDLARMQAETSENGNGKVALVKALHRRAADLKLEVRERLSRCCTEITIKPVQRTYAFEDPRLPRGKQWVLKVTCNMAPGALPPSISGRAYSAILGTAQTPLEAVLLKRRIMGPSWLSLHDAVLVDPAARTSWCKMEYVLETPKGIHNNPGSPPRTTPPLSAVALTIKTVQGAADKVPEVVICSLLHATVPADVPLDMAKWRSCAGLRRVSMLRRSSGAAWPPQLLEMSEAQNARCRSRNGGTDPMALLATERALLEVVAAHVGELDPDLIVGHNISGWDINILLQRMQHHKVLSWSRMGRFRRSRVPTLAGGGHMYGSGASQGVMTCMAGRMLVDTYVCSRDMVKEVEYSLSSLASKFLHQQRPDLQPHQVLTMCGKAESFLQLVAHAEADAWLAMGLTHYLSIIPLTLQLSRLSGFLWTRTLQGNRAQRIEMLLLHEFHKRKFLLPDKPERGASGVGKHARESAGAGAPATDGMAGEAMRGKAKGPQYAGGLVLEPKRGIYNRYVLLLDFNSLYPSIIQEYNICFTTVSRPRDDSIPALPVGGGHLAPLPVVVQGLVRQRRAAKAAMKGCLDPNVKRQLDIRQQALKLTANSMYGCLGFTASRFFCKPLAQLITSQGREILQSAVSIVRDKLSLNVIYGDTDSIMIATESQSMSEVLQLGQEAKTAVNKHYRLLEIDVDGIFKSMLLLKKKKYAAIKMEPGPTHGTFVEVLESKGLDIVRRDWCLLSREVGQQCLREILSGRDADDIAAAVHDLLRGVAARVADGSLELGQFVITKQLTKRPEDYPDPGSQAHVQVAMRMRARGYRECTNAGDTVPYVICKEHPPPAASEPSTGPGSVQGAGNSAGLASRAYHPIEIRDQQTLQIDTQYYLAHQIHPVVARLCAPLDSSSDARIAECLGLDPSSYRRAQNVSNDLVEEASGLIGLDLLLDNDDRFKGLPHLEFVGSLGDVHPLPDIHTSIERIRETAMGAPLLGALGTLPSPVTPAQIANQAALAARDVMKQFYRNELRSDDESAPCETREVLLAGRHPCAGPCLAGTCPPDLQCQGHMAPALSPGAAHRRLSHIARQLDVRAATVRVPISAEGDSKRVAFAETLLRGAHTSVVSLLGTVVYHWVNVAALMGGLAIHE